jgi:glycosyltransferase involved in cell wall biosynthesis
MFVSVIMPIYNGEVFLREAIERVLAQTHRDFELVAVDDGSTDASPAIIAEFAAADPG